ncbi:serine hydrolase [Lacticaseibacillus jixiensis]|uniref:serine hydrolase n=1 Tax=Lacticaseibacillus jixiensis TaxID=3231926 RepID=UPI0036F30C34
MKHHLTPLGKVCAAGLAVLIVGIGLWRLNADDPTDQDQASTKTVTTTKSTKAAKSTSHPKPAPSKPTATTIAAQLKQQWQPILAQHDEPIEIAVYSKQYDTTVALNSANDTTHTTASILKVTFLTELLHQHAAANTTLTTSEQTNAQAAIEHSDNAAATALYNEIGGASGVATAFANLGMSDSHAGTSGWVSTTTTAQDQLKLLNTVFYNGDYLTSNSREYIKGLMGSVASDQNWGVSAGAKSSQLKNGWRLNYDDTWIVNSIGHLGSGERSCTIAILTDHNASLDKGIALVEELAKASGKVLNLAQ